MAFGNITLLSYAHEMSAFVVVVPPAVCVFLLFLGMFVLSLATQPSWWTDHFQCRSKCREPSISSESVNFNTSTRPSVAYAQYDVDMINSLEQGNLPRSTEQLMNDDIQLVKAFSQHQNRPKALLLMVLPTIASLCFCPFTMVYPFLLKFFWPDSADDVIPNVNDAISCFLQPAGLVYAIAFGFAFQEALAKQGLAERNLSKLCNVMTEILLFIDNCQFSHGTVNSLLSFLRQEMLAAMLVVTNRKNHHNIDLWKQREGRYRSLLVNLTSTAPPVNEYQASLHQHLLEQVLLLRTYLTNRASILPPTIKLLQWVFLEALGFITFFGIVMTNAESMRLQLVMCYLTVFSLSMFSYILADLDHTQHGVFRVDMSVFLDVLAKIEESLRKSRHRLKSLDQATTSQSLPV